MMIFYTFQRLTGVQGQSREGVLKTLYKQNLKVLTPQVKFFFKTMICSDDIKINRWIKMASNTLAKMIS